MASRGPRFTGEDPEALQSAEPGAPAEPGSPGVPAAPGGTSRAALVSPGWAPVCFGVTSQGGKAPDLSGRRGHESTALGRLPSTGVRGGKGRRDAVRRRRRAAWLDGSRRGGATAGKEGTGAGLGDR